ncbi:hypothetical protein PENTCL1PPCAC_14792, partial [Pristionchus entomophagus]
PPIGFSYTNHFQPTFITPMVSQLTSTVSRVCHSSKWPVLGLVALFVIRRILARRFERQKIEAHYATRIKVARKEREENIQWAREQAKQVDEAERKNIERMNFIQLKDALQSGEAKVETAVRVYYGLAVRAHEKTNCLTNIVKRALDEAKAMDERAKDPTFTKPRLFGIPLSVKDAVELEGHRSTWGLAKMIDNYAKEDSYQVAKLRQEGMIPFCQTNVPTTCISYTCTNSVYGTTSCPLSSSRTCGGSSGGEGALIGCLGSLVGMGSDLGGSARIPAAYSGCCGFKPSATRFSTHQLPEPIPLRPFGMPSEGPLAQDPHAIAEVMRAVWSDHFISDSDPHTVPILFREDLFEEGRRFRIGYYTTDGYIDPLPGNQRVIREAVELLRAKGHELVPFSLGDIAGQACRGIFTTSHAETGELMAAKLKDEPLPPIMAPLRTFLNMPLWVKHLIGWMFKFRGDKNASDMFLGISNRAVDIQTGMDRVFACRKNLVKKMKDEQIDLILCPSTLSPALPHASPMEMPLISIMPTLLWNLADWPAGIVTTGSWAERDEEEMEAYEEKGLVEKTIKKACRNSVGLPLSVQIVAPAFRDEMVLRVMLDLYDEMKKEEARSAQ